MTNKQEEHLQKIKDLFNLLADNKYRKGQKEHGGNLFDMSPFDLINCAIDEAIDQVVYLITLKMNVIHGQYHEKLRYDDNGE